MPAPGVKLSAVALAIGLSLLAWPGRSSAASLPLRYPRLANYYLNPTMTPDEAEQLARWDVVILGVEAQQQPELFAIMRQRHPGIIILAYITSEEIPTKHLSITDQANPLSALVTGLPDAWWLETSSGARTGFWPGANMMNVTDGAPLINGQRWNTYLPKFMHDRVMSTGLWDGIFYDNIFNDISWLNSGDVDLNRDRLRDDGPTADAAWRAGMTTMLSRSRELEGNDAIIIGNGGGQYYPTLNGRLMESFPSTLDGGWAGAMNVYFNVAQRGLSPAVVVVNGVSSTGQADDYQTVRYVMASTLLGSGFFSFDQGPVQHAALWVYDEFQAYLGLPLSAAKPVGRATATSFTDGLWRREFQNGLVLVNATDTPQTVTLGEGYERLLGRQDPAVNSGAIVTAVRLAGRDGIILLKRQFTIDNGQFPNGGLTQIFSADGQALRRGFFSFNSDYAGGADIIVGDADRDGQSETIVADGGAIAVYDYRGTIISRFFPFGPRFTARLSIAIGDITGDGTVEIVTAPAVGAAPTVRVFSLSGRAVRRGFSAYRRSWRGGVDVAAADLNGDGRAEIITAPGRGTVPEVRIFTSSGRRLRSFLAYARTFRGGVRVAAGDLGSTGRPTIVTAPGPGGGPHVRLFSAVGRPLSPGFFAFSRTRRSGLDVAVADANHDGRNDILVSIPTGL